MQQPYRLIQKTQLTATVYELKFIPEGKPLIFQAGQYVDLVLPGDNRRPFSIASIPSDEALVFHIRHHEENDFTVPLFQYLEKEPCLEIDGPFGHSVLDTTKQKPLIMFAGGTGIVPMYAMLRSLVEMSSELQVSLYWGCAVSDELYLEKELSHLPLKYFRYVSIVEQSTASWNGPVGRIQQLMSKNITDEQDATFYIAGPYPMVRSVYQSLLEQKINKGAILSDML